jgi:ribosomal protein S10
MTLEYSLKLKSIHFKYLLLGVLAFLDILKKKEQIDVIGVSLKRTRKAVSKYTVLKSPFVNKKSREQFKLQLNAAVLVFSLKAIFKNKKRIQFFGGILESSLLKYLNSQYLEIKLIKRYQK